MMRMKIFAAIVLALMGTGAVGAQEPLPARATGVKAILVGDTRAFPNGDAKADVDSVQRYLCGLPGFFPARDLRVLEGNDVTVDKILEAVDDLEVKPTETLLFYYEGHGAFDPNYAEGDIAGGHLLQTESGDLLRAELMNRLRGKGAQLTLLITETCNVATEFTPVRHASCEGPLEPIVSATLEKLLYNYTGVVDVNAAEKGQSSWSTSRGGWFTQSLLQALDDEDFFLRGPLNGVLGSRDWSAFMNRVSDKTRDEFARHLEVVRKDLESPNREARAVARMLVKQGDQRPQVFQLTVQQTGPAKANPDYFVPPSPFDPEFKPGLKFPIPPDK